MQYLISENDTPWLYADCYMLWAVTDDERQQLIDAEDSDNRKAVEEAIFDQVIADGRAAMFPPDEEQMAAVFALIKRRP